jgi:GT2 family glycosyltransferase
LHHPSLFLSIWTEIIPIKQWLRRTHLVRSVLTKLFPNSSGLTSNYSVTHQVPVLDGGCLFIRREVLHSVGLLDPLIPQGPDDYDWCFRARQKGFEVWFVAESEVIHRTRPKEDLANVSPRYSRIKMPQMCYLYGKNHHGLLAKLFNWSACLLAWKWRLEARRRYGTDTEYDAALNDAIDLCLHPERYAREYNML